MNPKDMPLDDQNLAPDDDDCTGDPSNCTKCGTPVTPGSVDHLVVNLKMPTDLQRALHPLSFWLGFALKSLDEGGFKTEYPERMTANLRKMKEALDAVFGPYYPEADLNAWKQDNGFIQTRPDRIAFNLGDLFDGPGGLDSLFGSDD